MTRVCLGYFEERQEKTEAAFKVEQSEDIGNIGNEKDENKQTIHEHATEILKMQMSNTDPPKKPGVNLDAPEG